jgi:hypothetical protein
MAGREKGRQLEVTAESPTRTPSEFSVAGSFPEEENPTDQDPTIVAQKHRSDQEWRQTIHSVQKSAARYRSERDQYARNAIALEEAAAQAEARVERLSDTVEKLRAELYELRAAHRRSDREPTAETYATAATTPTTTWRARASDPDEKLTGTNPDKYGPWKFDIDLKLEVDSPMFPTERSKVRYTLAQLDLPIFTTMRTLVAGTPDTTLNELIKEVEHFTGVTTQRRDAQRELLHIAQRPTEKVNEYYHRVSSLWQKANTPEEDRADHFLRTILPTLAVPLVSKHQSSIRELLDDARAIESINKDVGNKNTGLHHRRAPDADRHQSTADSRFGAVSRKPEGWNGPWYSPQMAPKKLDDTEKRLLISQGRCWTCRGSGHRSRDPCCPKYKGTHTLADLEQVLLAEE